MPLSTAGQQLTDLYNAILARGSGKAVTSAGHKDRSVAYADTPLKDMIALYRTLWTKALGEETGLPLLNELGQVSGNRGLLRMRPF